jgi:hypothetical protein
VNISNCSQKMRRGKAHLGLLNMDRDNIKTDANNSIQFFIIYVPGQQSNGQLQTQHSLDAGIYLHYRQTQISIFTINKNSVI